MFTGVNLDAKTTAKGACGGAGERVRMVYADTLTSSMDEIRQLVKNYPYVAVVCVRARLHLVSTCRNVCGRAMRLDQSAILLRWRIFKIKHYILM
jgi:hypothetical protein